MGVTGAGKSYLISKISGQDVKIGHELESCTSEIEEVNIKQPDGSIVTLLDTPGFDDTIRTDTEILEMIAGYLYDMYSQDIKVTGIIYVHRISDVRMQGTSLKNLNMFEKLCGDSTFKNVVLLTTRWDATKEETYTNKEEELKKKFWKIMIHKGSKVMRYRDDADIRELMRHLLGKEGVDLLIQKELSDGKNLQDTGAGIVVNKELLDAEKKYRDELAEAEARMEKAMEERDEETKAMFQEEANRMAEKIAKIQEDKEALERNLRGELAESRKQMEEAKGILAEIEEDRKRMEDDYRRRQEALEKNYVEQGKKLEKLNAERYDAMEGKYLADKEKKDLERKMLESEYKNHMAKLKADKEREQAAMDEKIRKQREELQYAIKQGDTVKGIAKLGVKLIFKPARKIRDFVREI
jgi:hypothetical protein